MFVLPVKYSATIKFIEFEDSDLAEKRFIRKGKKFLAIMNLFVFIWIFSSQFLMRSTFRIVQNEN